MNTKDENNIIEILKEMGATSIKFFHFNDEAISFKFKNKTIVIQSRPINARESVLTGGVYGG